MKNFVITISREFGANGSGVAKALAKELGIYYLDRDLVEETAERMGTDISYVGDSEETSKNRLLHMTLPLGSGSISHEDEIFQVERSIIEDEASKQNIVVVGRCADYIFRDISMSSSMHRMRRSSKTSSSFCMCRTTRPRSL